MNNRNIKDIIKSRPITSYEDLCAERERLEELLKIQKAQIQRDVQNLRGEIQPIINVSEMIGKLLKKDEGKDAVVTAGTNITIDLITAKLFGKSNFLLRLVLPALLKNLSSHYIPKSLPPLNFHKLSPNGDPVRQRTAAVVPSSSERRSPDPTSDAPVTHQKQIVD
jgi:hypothetical protein